MHADFVPPQEPIEVTLAEQGVTPVRLHDGSHLLLRQTEHAYDPDWAAAIGVNTADLIYQSPETGEEAIDVSEVLVRNGVDLIVWDSVAATLPSAS